MLLAHTAATPLQVVNPAKLRLRLNVTRMPLTIMNHACDDLRRKGMALNVQREEMLRSSAFQPWAYGRPTGENSTKISP